MENLYLDFARISFRVPPPIRIRDNRPSKMTRLYFHGQTSLAQFGEDLLKVLEVLSPAVAVHHNVIYVRSGKALTTTEYMVEFVCQ